MNITKKTLFNVKRHVRAHTHTQAHACTEFKPSMHLVKCLLQSRHGTNASEREMAHRKE